MFRIFVVSLFFVGVAVAQPESPRSVATNFENTCAGNIIPINAIEGGGVLYKPSNLHGGRGPSFLVQNVGQRTLKKVLEIRNARCEPIASVGLYATDQPYGSRYYSLSGGSGHTDEALFNLASLVGSPNILVEGINGTWIRVRDPRERDGSVRK